MMITRRALLFTSLAAAVAGCQTTTSPQPVSVSRATGGVSVTALSLQLSDRFQRTEPDNGISDAEILTALQGAVTAQTIGASGGDAVRATVLIDRFQFPGGAAMLSGSNLSRIEARTTLVTAGTGQPVAPVVETVSTATASPSGSIMMASPAAELQAAAESFARTLRSQIAEL